MCVRLSVSVYVIVYCRSGDADDDLLADEFFKQNRMILSRTLRTPICIDPQFKAIACIKAAHQRQNNVKFLRFDATDSVGELLKAITLGEIVVLDDVHASDIDPTLMDLLEIKLLSWFSIHFSPLSHVLFIRRPFYHLKILLLFLLTLTKFILHLFFSLSFSLSILVFGFCFYLPHRKGQQTVCKSRLNRNRIQRWISHVFG